ncbi:MAG: YfhO family protein [Lachnospiraceae bacterium]|nr:YfhO family protein [Lachnospiraceae bacterium]
MNQNLKKLKIHNQLPHALSFFIPVLIMMWILYTEKFYPFGDKSALIMDMREQYVNFFASMRDALWGDNSLFYSWSRSVGGNYIGLFAYYIASPFSFITLFFPIKELPLAMDILLVLKVGLCGLSFSFFAKYLAKKIETSLGYFLVVPSICYALISYNMVYSLSVMWLDAVILLPLIFMGVEYIFDNKKSILYIICLSILFISNYYTGYMVAVFTAMYVLYRLIVLWNKSQQKELFQKAVRIFISTLLSIGLSAPLLISVWKDLQQGKLSSQNVNYQASQHTNFAFSQFFEKLLNGKYDSITNSGLPAIYCGYIMLALALIFFLIRTIKLREKLGALVIMGCMTASFYFVQLDIVWHGFQYPNWFPYRYAFLFSFFEIYMASQAMCHLSKQNWLETIAHKTKSWSVVKTISLFVLVICVTVEMGLNGKAMIQGLDNEFHYRSMTEYTDFIDKTKPLVDDIKETDSSFYRINQEYEYSKNDAMLLGYNGLTHYSSTFNAAINALTPSLGIAQGYFWNSGYGSNILLNSLLGVKYVISDKPVPQSYLPKQSTPYGSASYSNPLGLSIAYAAPVANLEPYVSDGDPFTNQNNFVNGITGQEMNYFLDCNPNMEQQTPTQWTYTFTTVSDNPTYLYMRANGASWADVYVNENWRGNYFSYETSGTLYLGDFKAGETVTVTVAASGSDNISVYYSRIVQLDQVRAESTLTGLAANEMNITKHNHGSLTGTIHVPAGSKIMTSIPYDEGWKIYVDGKQTSYEKYAGTFLTFTASEGDHTIVMKYTSPGFLLGVGIAAATIVLIIVYYMIKKKKEQENLLSETLAE